MEENEEGEVYASVASACLPFMALFIRASWSDRSRSVKMKDKNEEEDGGVEEGGQEGKKGISKRSFHTKNGLLIRRGGGERGERS